MTDISAFIPHIGFFEYITQKNNQHPLISFLKRCVLSNNIEFTPTKDETTMFKHIIDSSLEVFDGNIREALHAMINWFIGK